MVFPTSIIKDKTRPNQKSAKLMKGNIWGFAKGGKMKLEKAGWLKKRSTCKVEKKTLARLKKHKIRGVPTL